MRILSETLSTSIHGVRTSDSIDSFYGLRKNRYVNFFVCVCSFGKGNLSDNSFQKQHPVHISRISILINRCIKSFYSNSRPNSFTDHFLMSPKMLLSHLSCLTTIILVIWTALATYQRFFFVHISVSPLRPDQFFIDFF